MLVCVGAFIIYSFSFYRVYVQDMSFSCFILAHKKIEFFCLPRPASKGKRLLVEKVLLVFSFLLDSFFANSTAKKSCNAGKTLNFSSLCTVCFYVYPLLMCTPPSFAMQLKLRNFSLTSSEEARNRPLPTDSVRCSAAETARSLNHEASHMFSLRCLSRITCFSVVYIFATFEILFLMGDDES